MTAYYAHYWCLDGATRITGDAAHHVLTWDKDGVEEAIAATPTETETPGFYRVALTDAQAACLTGVVTGTSETAGAYIAGSPFMGVQAIRNALLLTAASTVEAGTVPLDSLAAFLRGFVRADTTSNPGYLTIYKSDGVTEIGRIALGFDADAQPVVSTGV